MQNSQFDTKEIPDTIINFVGTIKSVHYPKQGHTSLVVILTTQSERFILKRTTHSLYSSWMKKEYVVLTQLEGSGLPIPKAYLFVEAGEHCWLLMSPFNGVRLREYLFHEKDETNRKKVISQFGETLREIHTTPCPNIWITPESWLNSKLKEAGYNLENYEVDGSRELLHKLKSTLPNEIPNTLIHGDFTIDNVMVDNHQVVGVIDWGGAAFGDPRYDLALAIRTKPNAFEVAADKRWFLEAYGLRTISNEEFEYFENGLYAFF